MSAVLSLPPLAPPRKVAPSHAALAISITLGDFAEFLTALSVPGYYARDEYAFDAACESHMHAVAMPAGGPWPSPMPAAWEAVEPIDAEVR